MKKAVRCKAVVSGGRKHAVRIGTIALVFLLVLMGFSGCGKKESARKRNGTKTGEKSGNRVGDEGEADAGEVNREEIADEDRICQRPTGSIYLGPYGEYYHGYPTGTIPEEDSVMPPVEGRYLDGTRDLKSIYTFDEAHERFAIRLYDSTVIYTAAPELHPTVKFSYMNARRNTYQISASFYVTDPEGNAKDSEVRFLSLWDTEYTTIEQFSSAFREGQIDSVRKKNDVEFTKITIYEETDEHLFGSVVAVPDYDYGGVDHYVYYYAQTIGDRVFFAYYGTGYEGEQPLSEEGRADFLQNSQLLFSHLSEDDGREPYLVDKIVNVPIAGEYFIPNYNVLYSVSESQVGLSVKTSSDSYGVSIRFYEGDEAYEVRDGEEPWKDKGELKMRHQYGTDLVLIELDGRTCVFDLYNGFFEKLDNIDTVQAFFELLTDAGILET